MGGETEACTEGEQSGAWRGGGLGGGGPPVLHLGGVQTRAEMGRLSPRRGLGGEGSLDRFQPVWVGPAGLLQAGLPPPLSLPFPSSTASGAVIDAVIGVRRHRAN